MTPTELEALRRLLFFSVADAAEFVAHVRYRTWKRWEEGEREIPDDVIECMLALAQWREKAIAATAEKIDAVPGVDVALVWYSTLKDWLTLPRSAEFWGPHQSVCASLLCRYPSRISLVDFDAAGYRDWLGNRQDCEAARSEWASRSITVRDRV